MGKKNKDNILLKLQEPLAIIGLSCRFPGMDSDVEEGASFFEMLLNGQSPIKDIPKNRWDIKDYYDPNRKKTDKMVCREGGFIVDPQLFDASFFKISPAEAKQMDPQHRLFLEVAIRALNHANIRLDSLQGSLTGVYCGLSTHEYSQLNYKDKIKFTSQTFLGASASSAVGRLSHYLNLTGPCMAVDTACSSSLSALYLAATALTTGQCDAAIVGGVHLNLCPEPFIGLSKANMLSPTGRCKSFDAQADGFVRSEGCGVVIVKRLSDALADNNAILCVINSIVMNQDGNGPSLSIPNVNAQMALQQMALDEAGLLPADINYIEAHASGTVIGDGIELKAIQAIHQGHHSATCPLVIGALKSNLGHAITASGIAALIKAIHALQQEKIPPNLHFTEPLPGISPETIPAVMPTAVLSFLKNKNKKRHVQVFNYGFSGTNVCVTLEESPAKRLDATARQQQPHCFVVSAESELSLNNMLAAYSTYLSSSFATLEDVCATLINCRDHYRYRCAIIAQDKTELLRLIDAGQYDVVKVEIKKEILNTINNAQTLYEQYRAGLNIQLNNSIEAYNQVDLPLYCFDRQPYWHESRNTTPPITWVHTLYQYPKNQQIELIKDQLALCMQAILNTKNTDHYQDFESLGFTPTQFEEFNQQLALLFLTHNIKASPLLTLDKLARHIQLVMMPEPIHRQPLIHVLNPEPIAVIGMSCRFPKAANIDEFLALLLQGESGMSDIPLERWDNEKFYSADPDAPGCLYIKQLGLIDNVKHFDADFFGISPREAKLMSPQLRVFMEASYHALEDANLSLEAVRGSNTGVFVGVGTNEYPRVLGSQGVNQDDLNIYFATGNVLNALPGRVAYSFDFHGPIQAIDTACSSAMTAIHNACLSLQSGDCTMALAGGVNILLTPDSNITLSKARMLSPESRCKTFSDEADGYARSEGCGIVVLKRLSTALEDKDSVLAVIKGSAINSDGQSGGFTVPNGSAQEEVIRCALAKANLSPGEVDYIEAHGTATPVADPIEVNTLTKIFSDSHSEENPLYISSVKTNIGHCESASGVAGVIKAILSLKTKTLFKHLNFTKLNPDIQLKNTVIPLSTLHWHKANQLKCAGVSSFGFSGANAHIVLQQMPDKGKKPPAKPTESLLVLSAKKKESLELLLKQYQSYLLGTDESFADICYSAATCRSQFLFRVAIKASSAKEAAQYIANKHYAIHQLKKEYNEVLPFDFNNREKPVNLSELQQAFEGGLSINWHDFYQSLSIHCAKVKLPLYPFVREEHWFEDIDRLKDANLPKNWCFQTHWQAQSIEKSTPKRQRTHWLLVGGEQLAVGFRRFGLNIVLESEPYALDAIGGILFAQGLGFEASPDKDAFLTSQKNNLKTLLHLIKTATKDKLKIQLIVLTAKAIPELAVDQFNLSASPLLGFCKTLALELPQFDTILIDCDNPHEANYLTQVLDEMQYNHGRQYEHLIAYRDGKRLVARLKKATLVDKKCTLYGEGRYLITGGCGGLGLVTAQALLSAGAREVILAARDIEKPLVKAAIKKIKSAYAGRLIRTVSLDVSDKEQLRALLLDLNTDGLLKGIVHAAGAVIKAPLVDHEAKDVDYLFSAKADGAWYLHELTQHCHLDFFIVYSSISSVFGSNKEAVYSAANSFLDVLMAERQRLGLVGGAIQWGPWGETGMAKKRARDQSLKQALIHNSQGQILIKALVNGQLNQSTIIPPEYLQFMLDFVPEPRAGFYRQLAEDLSESGSQGAHEVSSWLSNYFNMKDALRFTACKDLVTDLCKAILELSTNAILNDDEGFFQLGFDSLMVTELASALKKELQPALKILVTIGFDYPTINKMAQYIHNDLEKHLIHNHTLRVIQSDEESIAIIGMSCILPNAPDIVAFETLLEEGLSGRVAIPFERWDNKIYYDANKNAPGKSYVNQLGLINNIKLFDAHFFGISPREAKYIEPQQRLFLECSYKALEHANYHSAALRGSLTGVFAGVGPNEYYAQLEKAGFSNEELSTYSITGNVLNLIPGRVAYTFDLKGPSISVDTACSSSLVAIHYACQSLKNREIDYAFAGGVNILLMPESNITLCKANALSPEGLCKTFDAGADGYARSEGCGVVLLKRLADALRDNDNILAVIKASAVNNDGKSAGLTVPNGKSQEEVMTKALKQSQLQPCDIGYIEAHGTGTPLGDPIEVHAINAIYGLQRGDDNPLYIGTVKTNIGHLESASGIAGLIKTVISLQNNKIYKHLNFKKLNPNIQLNDTRIALHNTDWYSGAKLKCAAVNAFGFSGTNAHLIVQEYSPPEHVKSTRVAQNEVLVLSACSQKALDNLVAKYQLYLANTRYDFSDVCFTAATCREQYDVRLALTATSCVEACTKLATGQVMRSSAATDQLKSLITPEHQPLVLDYINGKPVDWVLFYQSMGQRFIKVTLPNYCFDAIEFWPDKKSSQLIQANEIHPLLGQMLSMPGREYLFSNVLDLDRLSFIKQHSVFSKVIFPASGYIEVGLAASQTVFKCKAVQIEQFSIERPLLVQQQQEFQLQAKPINKNHYHVKVFAKQEGDWQLFSEMMIQAALSSPPPLINISTLKEQFGKQVDLSQIYAQFADRSLFYGEEFQVLKEGYMNADSVLANVVLTKTNSYPVTIAG